MFICLLGYSINKQVNAEKSRLQVKAYKSRLRQWWNTVYVDPNKALRNL